MMTQPTLFDNPFRADGKTYSPAQDRDRLKGQMLRVWTVMKDGRWRTLQSISGATGDPEASVSARLRDFNKDRYVGFSMESRREEGGVWVYRVVRV